MVNIIGIMEIIILDIWKIAWNKERVNLLPYMEIHIKVIGLIISPKILEFINGVMMIYIRVFGIKV